MPSIITRKYRVKNAKEFVNSLSTSSGDHYYMFFGRSVPWPGSADLGVINPNATAVPTPSDSVDSTAFETWRDTLAFIKLTSNDVSHVAPRYDWTANSLYSMYDHRSNTAQLYANSGNPFYVLTSTNEVFKCLNNGRYSGNNYSLSTVEPTTTGMDDITKPLITGGTPYSYTWKYLYTLDEDLETKYLTPEYVPVRQVSETLDTDINSPNYNDIYDDGSLQYDVFTDARASNGSIYAIVVEDGGSGYSQSTQVTIEGDGTDAEAVALVDAGSIKQVNMIFRGRNYSYANVVFTDGLGGGSGASAAVIISPRNAFVNSTGTHYVTNHGIDMDHELGATRVMIYLNVQSRGATGKLPVRTSYRRVGIVKNPMLYGTNTIATGTEYRQTWVLNTTNSSSALFTPNEIVLQNKGAAGIAYGVVASATANKLELTHVFGTFVPNISISGIGNGSTSGQVSGTITIDSLPEPFVPVIPPSGATATVESVETPEINPFSGDIMFIDNKTPVNRDPTQSETVRFVLTF